MGFEHPLVGMGPGSYQRNIGPFYDVVPRATGPNEPDTQNLYLVIVSTMGYPALFAFLAILYAAWNAGRDKEADAFQRAAAAGIIAFSLAAIWHPLLVRGLGIPLVFLLAIARVGGCPAAKKVRT